MLHISMSPTTIYGYKPTHVTINFLLKELDFGTNLRFKICLPDQFVRITGALEGKIGLIQREQETSHTLELFCKVPDQYNIVIHDISYHNRVNQVISVVNQTFFLNVVERPDKKTKHADRKERCIQALSNQQELFRFMDKHFDRSELRTLLFNMQVDHERFPDEKKPSLIQEIILHCQRHGNVDELVKLVCQGRPNIKF